MNEMTKMGPRRVAIDEFSIELPGVVEVYENPNAPAFAYQFAVPDRGLLVSAYRTTAGLSGSLMLDGVVGQCIRNFEAFAVVEILDLIDDTAAGGRPRQLAEFRWNEPAGGHVVFSATALRADQVAIVQIEYPEGLRDEFDGSARVIATSVMAE